MNPQESKATISWNPGNYSTDGLAIVIGILERDRDLAVAEAAAEAAAPYDEQIAIFEYELGRRAPIEVTA